MTSSVVFAPVAGRALRLGDVPDPVFAAGLVGAGVAVDPPRGPVVATAPLAGSVEQLYPHLYVVRAADGGAVLVHLGIKTVGLGSAGFEPLVAENAAVEAGDPVVSWNPADVEASGLSPICPIVALDASEEALSDLVETGEVAVGSPLFTWDR